MPIAITSPARSLRSRDPPGSSGTTRPSPALSAPKRPSRLSVSARPISPLDDDSDASPFSAVLTDTESPESAAIVTPSSTRPGRSTHVWTGKDKGKGKRSEGSLHPPPDLGAMAASASGVSRLSGLDGIIVAEGGVRPQAGPSTTPSSTSQKAFLSNSPANRTADRKGKGKYLAKLEKRVLPARIRRAAGSGAEGMRDLEEMIVDWLERWGEPSSSPPDNLPIHLTTLPLALVDPPSYLSLDIEPSFPATIHTPTKARPSSPSTPSAATAAAGVEAKERIEVPTWVIVRPGEDDAEEAREELGDGKARSPVKRLRTMSGGEQPLEDTSDAYYLALHRKYEVFERRQRIREKEKLQFERYKMRSRIELLRNMGEVGWATVVATVLSRRSGPGSAAADGVASLSTSASASNSTAHVGASAGSKGDAWAAGRNKVRTAGAGWLRDRLVMEGEEVLRRYDQLLPPEHKKQKGLGLDGRLGTPTPSMPSPSVSPPPHLVLSVRVNALREPSSSARNRRGGLNGLTEVHGGEVQTANDAELNRSTSATKRKRRSPVFDEVNGKESPSQRARTVSSAKKRHSPEDIEARTSPVEADRSPAATSPLPTSAVEPLQTTLPLLASPSGTTVLSMAPRAVRQSLSPTPSSSRTFHPFFPPLTPSGLPCLIEAASRREATLSETAESKARLAAGRIGRLLVREKTRASGRLGLVYPFGMPVPVSLERKSEFTLSEAEEFWPMLADREARAVAMRRARAGMASTATTTQMLDPFEGGLGVQAGTAAVGGLAGEISADDVREMREVEAAVVL